MAKRGRPIKWWKAYSDYKRTVEHYNKQLGTGKSEWYMEDFHQFKERVMSQRDVKNDWTVAKTVSYFAQKSALNGATKSQVDALRRAGAEFGDDMRFKKAVELFRSANGEDMDDIKKFVNKKGWFDEDDFEGSIANLGDAVRNGELTISEMYKYLASIGIDDSEERRKYISQNVFGSD